MSSWVQARDQIRTRILANSTVPTARVNVAAFNGAKFDYPESDYTTNGNAVWIHPQADSVPQSARPLGIGMTAPMHRQGLLTLSFFFMANVGESDFATYIDPLVEAMQRKEFGVVQTGDFDEPDYIGEDENHGSEFSRVDLQCGYNILEWPTTSLIVDNYITIESNPATHGFAVLDVVGHNDSTGDWQQVVATTAGYANISELGVVFYVPNTNDAILALPGAVVSITGHGLTVGALYVDQSTAGLISNTEPTSGVRWRVGTALDANKIHVNPDDQPEEL